jgi:hypothetical protein
MLLIVAYDAGGAEVISSYVRQQQLTCIYSLAGPALNIFQKKIGDIKNLPLEKAMMSCDSLLCGTGWQSELEWEAVQLANKYGKHSVAFLDHWVHYKERFIRKGGLQLPSEIWVGDEDALRIAQNVFSDVSLPIKLVPNPYVNDIKNDLSKYAAEHKSSDLGKRILYICEAMQEDELIYQKNKRAWGYTEADALRYFFENISILSSEACQITIRPHPAEKPGKYQWVSKEYKQFPIKISEGRTLVQDVLESDLIVGCESMALTIALLAGKRVISCIPPGGKPCALPSSEIEHLQQLVGKR